MRSEGVSPPQSQGTKSAAATMHKLRWRQKILLAGGSESRQSLRASILRARGLEVDVANGLTNGRALCRQNTYDWVVLDTHSLLPGEAIDFCEQLKRAVPRQRIAFFVGAPTFISLKRPDEDVTKDKEQERRASESKSAA
jgi:response regulator RpfG family c-di-GMP phosphodiesterase